MWSNCPSSHSLHVTSCQAHGIRKRLQLTDNPAWFCPQWVINSISYRYIMITVDRIYHKAQLYVYIYASSVNWKSFWLKVCHRKKLPWHEDINTWPTIWRHAFWWVGCLKCFTGSAGQTSGLFVSCSCGRQNFDDLQAFNLTAQVSERGTSTLVSRHAIRLWQRRLTPRPTPIPDSVVISLVMGRMTDDSRLV